MMSPTDLSANPATKTMMLMTEISTSLFLCSSRAANHLHLQSFSSPTNKQYGQGKLKPDRGNIYDFNNGSLLRISRRHAVTAAQCRMWSGTTQAHHAIHAALQPEPAAGAFSPLLFFCALRQNAFPTGSRHTGRQSLTTWAGSICHQTTWLWKQKLGCANGEGIPDDIMPEDFGSIVMFATNMAATMEYCTEAVDTRSRAEWLLFSNGENRFCTAVLQRFAHGEKFGVLVSTCTQTSKWP